RIQGTNWHLINTLAGDERDTDPATDNWPTVPGEEHLEFLRAMMRGAVKLGSRQQAGVIGESLLRHQCRNELLGRQAAQRTVFRGNDHVELALGRGEVPLLDLPT